MNFELVLPLLREGKLVKRISKPGVLIGLEPAYVADFNVVPDVFRAQAVQARELFVQASFVSLWEDVIIPFTFTAEDILASDWQEEGTATTASLAQQPVLMPEPKRTLEKHNASKKIEKQESHL